MYQNVSVLDNEVASLTPFPSWSLLESVCCGTQALLLLLLSLLLLSSLDHCHGSDHEMRHEKMR